MIRIAREGLREILLSTLLLGGAAAAAGWAAATVSLWFLIPAAFLASVWVFTLLFFRDPERQIPGAPGILVSPADGTVADIAHLDSYPGMPGAVIRIGVFLSVFDVHINRSPCAGRVSHTAYTPGKFLDARHPNCGSCNEANTIALEPSEEPAGPIIVRQIAGLIARRIVCRVQPGSQVGRGERIGLIKFGSRTELIVAAEEGWKPSVRIGDRVHGGSSIIMTCVEKTALAETGALEKRRQPATSAAGQGER